MKRILVLLILFVGFNACQENEKGNSDLTGNETTYALSEGSAYPVDGTITFKEKTDGSTLVRVEISGTRGEIKHPVHIHMGDISTPDASVSALLNPVSGKTGVSETYLNMLADETVITYRELLELNACVKIHLSDSGPDKNIILAAGNIGVASVIEGSNGRAGIRVCKSE